MKYAAERFGDGFNVVDLDEKHLRSYMVYLKNERGNTPVTHMTQHEVRAAMEKHPFK